MNIIDTHTHTSFSFDGENTPREMAEKAIELGVQALTFTDHIDVNDYYDSYYKESTLMPKAAKAIPPLKDEYENKIRIGFGGEIGQFMQNPPLAEKLIRDFNLDYVIGSTHSVKGYEDFYFLNFHKHDAMMFLRLYFAETLDMVKNADIDVIAHLTYPLRYITGNYNIEVDMGEFDDIIRDIFGAAAERGIGLEINTGGLRKPEYGKADPDSYYVKLFRESGGEIITIGSDAHRISDLAANFKKGAEIARSARFKQIAFFEKRKPVFVDLL
ncbi:MAG: histidinol-phosphatase HisJ family protein [Oscillospiraceae bacterium]|nr:histidinol-phosphatase HisJ family protein [Oscillospiraceae bacterium]